MKPLPRVLCVDDEPMVLEGLVAWLRRRFQVETAASGEEALLKIQRGPPFAVVVSDMRMPQMDGATLLAQLQRLAPETVRVMLTGLTDITSAVDAVNEGRVFQFLTKPCEGARLLKALDAAVEQHRLLTAERVLLEETLRGSIQALTELLALGSPAAFGRATRIQKLAGEIARAVAHPWPWKVEVGAMLSQIALMTLPDDTLAKIAGGEVLGTAEEQMVRGLPAVSDRLLGHIPRLEDVRAMITASAKRGAPKSDDPIALGAAILELAVAFDTLESRGVESDLAIDALRASPAGQDGRLLEALSTIKAIGAQRREVRELALVQLQIGMVLLDDMKLNSGLLIAPRGYEVSRSFVERARNFASGSVREPIRVVVPAGAG